MSGRAKAAAILLSAAFCAGSAAFLAVYGASHRTMLSSPVVEVIAAPHDAFAVWRKHGIHGRVLVLIDRHLNAEIDDRTDEFSRDEFTGTYRLARLCAAMQEDLRGSSLEDFPCTMDTLNDRILKRLSLYPLFLRKGAPDPDGRITTLAGFLALPDAFEVRLPQNSANDLARFNRLVLERLYPDRCPPMPDFYILPVNYAHQAIRAGMVRKIYHLLPESAWAEVSSVLGSDRRVESSGGSFRMTIAEGVSVTIMRFRDFTGLGELPIVNVNTDSLGAEELRALPGMLRGTLRSDLVTVSGVGAAELAAAGGKAHGAR